MPQSCSEGDAGDVCKDSNLDNLCKNIEPKNRVGVLEQEWSSVEIRRRATKKRSNALLFECSTEELQEKGSVAVVSRPKTLSPGTPPERLPTQGRRDMMVGGKSRSSSSNDCPQVGQEDYIFGALNKRKISGCVNSYGGSKTVADSKSTRDKQFSKRTDLKRGSCHMIAAQITKKRRLNSHQANHGCHFASLLIRKFSKVHSSKTALKTHVEAEIIQQKILGSPEPCPSALPLGGRVVTRKFSRVPTSKTVLETHVEAETNNKCELSNDSIAFSKFSNGASDYHVSERADRQKEPIKVENTCNKKKVKADPSEMGDVLQEIPFVSIKEKSKQLLKVKKCKKICKSKERVKSKEKAHLPGCPCLTKGLVSDTRAPVIPADSLSPSGYMTCGVQENPASLLNEHKEAHAHKVKKRLKSKDNVHQSGWPHLEKALVSVSHAPKISADSLNPGGFIGCERTGVQESPASRLIEHKEVHLHKAKKRVKSKDNVHLPGRPHLEKGLVPGSHAPNISADAFSPSSYIGCERSGVQENPAGLNEYKEAYVHKAKQKVIGAQAPTVSADTGNCIGYIKCERSGVQENPANLLNQHKEAYVLKAKKRVKSKDKLHLQGWSHLEKGLVCGSQPRSVSEDTCIGSGYIGAEKSGVRENPTNFLVEQGNLHGHKAKKRVEAQAKDRVHLPGWSRFKERLVCDKQISNLSASTLNGSGYNLSGKCDVQENNPLVEEERMHRHKAKERVKSKNLGHLPCSPDPKRGLVCGSQPPKASADILGVNGYSGSERYGTQEILQNDLDQQGDTFGCEAKERVKAEDNVHLPGCLHPKKEPDCDNQPSTTDIQNGSDYTGFERSVVQANPTNLPNEHEKECPIMSDSSGDEGKQRGRSKFERWKSHSEQYELDIPSDTQNGSFRPSDTQNGSRISLSKKLATTMLGQGLRKPNDLAVRLSNGVQASKLSPGARQKWKVATRFAGRLKAAFDQQDHILMSRSDEQQNAQKLHQFVAKLEERRERFNLTLEEIGPSQKLANKGLPFTERPDVRSDRPARKRCWGVADAVH